MHNGLSRAAPAGDRPTGTAGCARLKPPVDYRVRPWPVNHLPPDCGVAEKSSANAVDALKNSARSIRPASDADPRVPGCRYDEETCIIHSAASHRFLQKAASQVGDSRQCTGYAGASLAVPLLSFTYSLDRLCDSVIRSAETSTRSRWKSNDTNVARHLAVWYCNAQSGLPLQPEGTARPP